MNTKQHYIIIAHNTEDNSVVGCCTHYGPSTDMNPAEIWVSSNADNAKFVCNNLSVYKKELDGTPVRWAVHEYQVVVGKEL